MTAPITTAPGTAEREWLANSLAQSIANLGYPVGLGVSPAPDHCQKAADALLTHFHERDSVRDAATLPALQEHADAMAEALVRADRSLQNVGMADDAQARVEIANTLAAYQATKP